jgi:actin related protein 2/3 complex subunit 1A/1B
MYLICNIRLGGWVHDVSFSAAGDKLAWVGHDSSISVVAASNQAQIYTIKGDFLPLITCTWITSNSVVAAGKMMRTTGFHPPIFSLSPVV